MSGDGGSVREAVVVAAAVTGAVELEWGVFGDFLEVGVDGVEPDIVVDGDGGDEDVEPRAGDAVVAKSPCEGDGAIPVILAAGPVGDDGEAFAEECAFLLAGAAEDLDSNRRAPLGLVGFQEAFDGEFHPHVAVAAEAFDPCG